jgi:hypothetical protein
MEISCADNKDNEGGECVEEVKDRSKGRQAEICRFAYEKLYPDFEPAVTELQYLCNCTVDLV